MFAEKSPAAASPEKPFRVTDRLMAVLHDHAPDQFGLSLISHCTARFLLAPQGLKHADHLQPNPCSLRRSQPIYSRYRKVHCHDGFTAPHIKVDAMKGGAGFNPASPSEIVNGRLRT